MRFQPNVRRIAAIHDLSGIGRTSLMAVIPILSTMGFNVCPLPTAILSNHSQYPDFSFLDLTEEMPRIIDQWEKLGVTFDAIYTGYMGSPRQIEIVCGFIERFRTADTLVVVDPVLGDNGHLYSKMTQEMVEEMRRLACRADVLTPNLTEAFALLDRPYKTDCTTEELKDLIAELSEMGPDTVIITGVPVPGQSGLTSVIARSKSDLRTWKVTCPYLPAHYPGTGDSFTSVITGSLLQGDSLPIALDRAAQFILQGIRSTFGYRMDNRDGILLERVLPNLNTPIQSATYELV
ncbi:pyridoxamine kinase [Sutterella sp. AM11-39]|jgi:putative pyridoxal kinase|uniref:pyridoxamine kinase n=1 Tax=Sutterella sp. AM11-39 TaxID=2292075 RepID=UPI000E4E5D7D|nr:pyridoxamine kinase [Sutterella sp. AM11-39]RHJ32541.1 pyridoxamine kinase [Sutterella sp. AM11-39]HJA16555.1 pyridoxamine kinase [Candidatus Duodenibacillus intestinigallinarum]